MTILEQVSEQSGHSIERILSKRRFANITRARHCAMWAMRQQGMSFPAIGRVFNRHHTSVMHACSKVESLRGKVGPTWALAVML